MNRDHKFRRLSKILAGEGFLVVQGKTHYRVTRPSGQAVYSLPTSPSCPHWASNALKALVRLGIVGKEYDGVRIR